MSLFTAVKPCSRNLVMSLVGALPKNSALSRRNRLPRILLVNSTFLFFNFSQPLRYFVLCASHIPSPNGNTIEQGRFRTKF